MDTPEAPVAGGWTPRIISSLTEQDIRDVLALEVPYLLIPGFLASGWCAEITRRFMEFVRTHPENALPMKPCSVDTVVLPMNVFMRPDDAKGPSNLDAYFARVPGDRATLRKMYEGGPDPFPLLQKLWRGVGWREVETEDRGRPYHTDVLWGLPSPGYSPPHVDSYHLETPCSLNRFRRRFSCNLFIQSPEEGGNFRVFRLRKQDGGWNGRPPGVASAEYVVRAGDLLLFDALNYHEVLPVGGDRHRVFSHTVAVFDPELGEYSLFV